jgi:hypothetical protein
MATGTGRTQESDAHKDAPTDAPTRGRRDARARSDAGCSDHDENSAHTSQHRELDEKVLPPALTSAAPAASSDKRKSRSTSSPMREKPAGNASMAAADFPQLEEFGYAGYANTSASLPVGAEAPTSGARGSQASGPEGLATCTGRGRKPGYCAAHYPAQ